jgi:hypothetical protein
VSDRKRGRQPGQQIDSRALSGTIGVSNLRRMVGSLVRSMSESGLSASMKLKLVREINALRADIAKAKLEAARRKAAALLSESSHQPSA